MTKPIPARVPKSVWVQLAHRSDWGVRRGCGRTYLASYCEQSASTAGASASAKASAAIRRASAHERDPHCNGTHG
jgi:hypothetical protein